MRRTITAALGEVAERLGNTPAVARASYVDPGIIEAWAEGAVTRVRLAMDEGEAPVGPPTPEEEAAVMRILERQARAARAAATPRRRGPSRSDGPQTGRGHPSS
jgi:DNA topoisomerase-1